MSMSYKGIPYFPIDANFFEGEVLELLEARFGMQASYIIMRLLCKIYKEGYYISWGDEQCAIFLRKIGGEVKKETINQIVELLLEKGFFNKEYYEQYEVLTSVEIQKIWFEATSRRKLDFTELPYLLVKETEIKRGKSKWKTSTSKENVDNLSTQDQTDQENADNSEQSKSNESKTDNNKADESKKPSIEGGGRKNIPFEIPQYAYNKATHNIMGLIDNLKSHKVTDSKEQQAILRLSDYGKKDTPVWKLLLNTNWSKIGSPGRYIIAALS